MAKAQRQGVIWDLQGSKNNNLEYKSGEDREMAEDEVAAHYKLYLPIVDS